MHLRSGRNLTFNSPKQVSRVVHKSTKMAVPDELKDINLDLQKHSDFIAIKTLGQGAQGKVILVQSPDDKQYAVKVVEYFYNGNDLITGRDNSLSDFNFSLIMDHPYIIKSHELIVGEKYMFLIMEKANEDLKHFLDREKLSPIQKLQDIFKLASALDYIHQSGFIHCDLKSVNTLVKNGNLLISDFGLIKLLDDASAEACQTLNYRAPEAITEEDYIGRYESIYKNRYETWRKRPQASEIWSFGILCLDVMYNSGSITLNDRINNGPFTKDVQNDDIPYFAFINTLTKLDDPQYLLRDQGETVYSLVVSMLGPVSEINKPLLRLICDKLLILDQEQRIIGFTEFINNDLFAINGLKLGVADYYQYPRVDRMYTPSQISMDNLSILFSWMIEVSDVYELYPIVVMNAIDYVMQHCHIPELISGRSELQKFGICVMWIIQNIYNYNSIVSLSDCIYICDYIFTAQQAIDMIIKILRYEHGRLKFESLYFQLPSEQLLVKAIGIMRDAEAYIGYETPHNLAMALIRDETSEELEMRRPKAFRDFNYEIEKDRVALSERGAPIGGSLSDQESPIRGSLSDQESSIEGSSSRRLGSPRRLSSVERPLGSSERRSNGRLGSPRRLSSAERGLGRELSLPIEELSVLSVRSPRRSGSGRMISE
jgi:serine/threonine protein kinase